MIQYKYIYLFFALALFTSCGEDFDINDYAAKNGLTPTSNTFTQMGDITKENVTSTSVKIPIVRQSASSNEYVWVVPKSVWDSYSTIYSDTYYNYNSSKDNTAIVKGLEKTWTDIQINGLKPSTEYYYFQSTNSSYIESYGYYYYDGYYSTKSQAKSAAKSFTTTEPEAHISKIEKLGCRRVKFTVNVFGEHGICYSQTNSKPTVKDYTWTGTDGVVYGTVESGEAYYCRPYITVDGEKIYGDVTTVKTNPTTDVYANPVDLGVSVKWADRMLMAEAPLPELSKYSFAFGNTPFKESYDSYSSYGYSSSLSSPSKDTDAEHDAATYWWGSKWRTPTKDEVNELNDLPRIRTKIDGVEGLLIKGKSNSPYKNNSIFIPDKKYWTSTYSSSYSDWMFKITSGGIELSFSTDSYYYSKYIIPVLN